MNIHDITSKDKEKLNPDYVSVMSEWFFNERSFNAYIYALEKFSLLNKFLEKDYFLLTENEKINDLFKLIITKDSGFVINGNIYYLHFSIRNNKLYLTQKQIKDVLEKIYIISLKDIFHLKT